MKRILVIEDSQDFRELLKALLEIEGYDVQTATHGQEALELLRAAKALPGMILLDLMMPVMDGVEFRRRQVGDAQQAQMQLEARDCIRKPPDLEHILSVVKQHCGESAAAPAVVV